MATRSCGRASVSASRWSDTPTSLRRWRRGSPHSDANLDERVRPAQRLAQQRPLAGPGFGSIPGPCTRRRSRPAPVAAALCDAAGVDTVETALDVGCGPEGLVAEPARRLGAERVAGVEPS